MSPQTFFLDQLGNWFAVVEDRDRSTGGIEERLFDVDTELPIDGRQHISRRQGAIGGNVALTRRRTDYAAHLQAAARDEHRHRLRPMVAADETIDPRRPSELAPHQHQHSLTES